MKETSNDQSLFLRFLMSPKTRLVRHLSLILVLTLLSLLSGGEPEQKYYGNITIYVTAALFLWFITPFYLNMYLLVPRLLFKGKLLAYMFTVILLILGSFLLLITGDEFLQKYRINPVQIERNMVQAFLGFLLVFAIVMAASTAVKLFQRWVKDSQTLAEVKQQALRAELSQLKGQVNPHFLFNTLNNAHVLTQTNPDKASAVLISLSRMLRYQLYDGDRELVPLRNDLNFLEDFLELEKIRREGFDYEINLSGSLMGIMIPHFLFIPFVENAVKHSYDIHQPSFVKLWLSVNNSFLCFSCSNSVPEHPLKQERSNGGIGLANIRRRLELLYAEDFILELDAGHLNYLVNMKIPLPS
ncbi:sensor histidine kinase [Pedobacter nutrimenti]|jgi:sensor histidine kinase YesM|uniref:Histidine kinase n=1 Tax=Pedobacter nutrimenti TaxID=1241337 RepID=A0A318UPB9_9SPHI|nr:histidine kinase [Pedobacter nutrimenti]PYF77307.1 histidine kinase [Pedobacter nutrimenti]